MIGAHEPRIQEALELRRQEQPLASALNRYSDRPLGPGDCTAHVAAEVQELWCHGETSSHDDSPYQWVFLREVLVLTVLTPQKAVGKAVPRRVAYAVRSYPGGGLRVELKRAGAEKSLPTVPARLPVQFCA